MPRWVESWCSSLVLQSAAVGDDSKHQEYDAEDARAQHGGTDRNPMADNGCPVSKKHHASKAAPYHLPWEVGIWKHRTEVLTMSMNLVPHVVLEMLSALPHNYIARYSTSQATSSSLQMIFWLRLVC